MHKTRLENFSDSVFAFAVTLLIINVHIPERANKNFILSNQGLNNALLSIIPNLATFAFSFLVVGVFWVAHHRIFDFVKLLDKTLLWLNIVYLLFIATIPIAAAIISEYPFLPTAILFYSATLFIIAVMHLILLQYMLRNETLKDEGLTRDVYRVARRAAIVGPVCYIIAAAASFINVYISLFFILSAMIFYIFFSGKKSAEKKMILAPKKEGI